MVVTSIMEETILVGSGPSVSSTQAAEGSYGLSRSRDDSFFIDDDN